MSYWRFAAMIATSTLLMLGLMYIHTYIWDHAYFSEHRAWMALLMGAGMAIVMLGYMLNMYKSRSVNLAIFMGAAGRKDAVLATRTTTVWDLAEQ